MGNNLQFKLGAYANLNTSTDIENGDICFGTYSSTQGTLAIKHNNKIMNVLPPSGTFGYPLIGQGDGKSPIYDSSILLTDWELFNDTENENAVMSAQSIYKNKEARLSIGRRIHGVENAQGSAYNGVIRLYSSIQQHSEIRMRTDSGPQKNAEGQDVGYAPGCYNYFYLPPPMSSDGTVCYAAWTVRNSSATPYDLSKGTIEKPVYLDANGQVVSCKGVVMTSEAQQFSGTKTFGWLYATYLFPRNNTGYAQLGGINVSNNQYPWGSVYTSDIIFETSFQDEQGAITGFQEVGSIRTERFNNKATSIDSCITRLTLGNGIPVIDPATNNFINQTSGRWGEIVVYAQTKYRSIIRSGVVNNSTYFYLPEGNSSGAEVFATWIASRSTGAGAEDTPIYATTKGELKPVKVLSVLHGGTGVNGIASNRIPFMYRDANDVKLFGASNHFINNEVISVNCTWALSTGQNFFVNGSSKLGGDEADFDNHTVTFGGRIVLAHPDYHYATVAPTKNVNLSSPVQGQIYFQII